MYNASQFVVVLLIAAGCALISYGRQGELQSETRVVRARRLPVVYELRGDVAAPGLYRFEREQPMEKLAAACGAGLSARADSGAPVSSGRRLIFDCGIRCEAMDAAVLMSYAQPLSFAHATTEDLALIPGIGRQTARALVAYRERVGGVRSLEELMAVKGIGPKTLGRISRWLIL